MKLADGTNSPVFGEQNPDRTWEMPQGQDIRQIGIKQVEESHVCGISMFSSSGEQLIQTLEDAGSSQVSPGYWKHFRVKETEVVLGIHGIVQCTPVRKMEVSEPMPQKKVRL